MLRHVEGGDGRGSHKRFAPAQVTIAAILGEVRDNFGAGGKVLPLLAELLQDSVALFEDSPLHIANWEYAAKLSTDLAAFRSGKPVIIWRDADERKDVPEGESQFKRAATSEAEIIGDLGNGRVDYDGIGGVIKAASKIPPGRDIQADVAQTILAPILCPGFQDDVCWLLRLKDDGLRLVEGSNGGADFQNFDPAEMGCAMFLPVDAIVRRTWKIPNLSALRLQDAAQA